jgi:hypothetical protein
MKADSFPERTPGGFPKGAPKSLPENADRGNEGFLFEKGKNQPGACLSNRLSVPGKSDMLQQITVP